MGKDEPFSSYSFVCNRYSISQHDLSYHNFYITDEDDCAHSTTGSYHRDVHMKFLE